MAKLWRIIKWWWRCLWAGKIVPRVLPGGLYSRSFIRKVWKNRLRQIDFDFNRTGDRTLLMLRRIMVAKRRAYRFE